MVKCSHFHVRWLRMKSQVNIKEVMRLMNEQNLNLVGQIKAKIDS